MNTVANRKVHLDLLRVIASFCVILIHCFIYRDLAGEQSEFNIAASNFYGILSRWAVPCFVMISGMMFLNENKDIPIKKLYSKYILRLFVSYVFWSCVYAAFNSLFEVGDSLSEKFRFFINNCFSGELHMWYVLMIIGLYIASPVIKFLVNNMPKKLLKYWIMCMFAFSSLIPFIGTLNIPYFSGVVSYLNRYVEIYFLMGYTIYFVLGHYLDKYGLSKKTKKLIYILGVVGFLYCVLILLVINPLLGKNMSALNYLYPNMIFYSIAVFLLFRDHVSQIKFSDKAANIIVSISKLTYGIFLIHVLILKVLYHLGIRVTMCSFALSYPLVSILTFVISAIIIFAISKIPVINKYIC